MKVKVCMRERKKVESLRVWKRESERMLKTACMHGILVSGSHACGATGHTSFVKSDLFDHDLKHLFKPKMNLSKQNFFNYYCCCWHCFNTCRFGWLYTLKTKTFRFYFSQSPHTHSLFYQTFKSLVEYKQLIKTLFSFKQPPRELLPSFFSSGPRAWSIALEPTTDPAPPPTPRANPSPNERNKAGRALVDVIV